MPLMFSILLSMQISQWIQIILTALSFIGSIASIIGIIISYQQIKKIKSVSEATDDAVKDTQKKLNRAFSMVDISKCIERIPTIKGDIHSGRLEIAHIRLRQIQGQLIEIKEVPHLKDTKALKEISEYIPVLGSSISLVQKYSYASKDDLQRFDPDSILQALDKLYDSLSTLGAELKYKDL